MFNFGQPTIGTFPAFDSTTPYPEASHSTIGASFYTLSKFLPSSEYHHLIHWPLLTSADTHMIWGLNFGLNDTSNAIAEAKSIIAAFKSSEVTIKGIKLDFIELGAFVANVQTQLTGMANR